MNKKISILAAGILIFSAASFADAAQLYLIPNSASVEPGDTFEMDLKLNTEGGSINAAQTTVNFPNNVLELVGVSRTDSIFDFWLEEPSISNQEGTMSFIGGTTGGVQGAALHILTLRFRAFDAGSGSISLSNSVVTANDGEGTDVLSSVNGAAINVAEQAEEAPEEESPIEEPEEEEVEEPEVIEREPVPSGQLPSAPQVKVPLYPEEGVWYNHLGEVIALWDLPEDVILVETKLSQSRDRVDGTIEEDLVTGKRFGILEEGIWYIRVQFRNNVGWGPFTWYEVRIDATSPLSFEIEIDDEASDNPTPEIFFETEDSLSGISHAVVFIDGMDPVQTVETTSTSMVLPPQPPGMHDLRVRIMDEAGNGVEDDLRFEIIPLPTPVIEFATRAATQGEAIFLSGRSISNAFIDLRIFNQSGEELLLQTTQSSGVGDWQISIEEALSRGKYKITVTARDERGALSYPTESLSLNIREEIIFSVGPVDLGWFEIAIIIFLLAVAGISGYAWYNVSMERKRAASEVIEGRNVKDIAERLEEDISQLEEKAGDDEEIFSPTVKAEIEYFLKRMRKNVRKMKNYLGK
ncbi:MAG: cohesin domain-containing protein [Candidatus Paceibacterota bacterium]|jgi:hypothetical protein|nr:cohesin domain-containing protein [Candidatus Paceibacterota bacterium]